MEAYINLHFVQFKLNFLNLRQKYAHTQRVQTNWSNYRKTNMDQIFLTNAIFWIYGQS